MNQERYADTRHLLIAVDVQNDFVDGSLAVKDGIDVVAPLNTLAHAVRRDLGRVAFTRDWHPDTTPHFDQWPVHCVAETDGAAFQPNLQVKEGDVILNKGTGQTDGYSGAEGVSDDGTTLETLIEPVHRDERVRVFVGGLATDYCVKATAIDLARRYTGLENVSICVITDAMRAVNIQPNDGQEAVEAMADAGVHIINLDDALKMIDETRLER
ncbi:MAG TPA: isochorismatase family protein [Candidatus Nanoperiomorbaceae bacterium]|nr:isochorismatase family protein [Candidatus Nanoperiomorbaceae bacterium]